MARGSCVHPRELPRPGELQSNVGFGAGVPARARKFTCRQPMSGRGQPTEWGIRGVSGCRAWHAAPAARTGVFPDSYTRKLDMLVGGPPAGQGRALAERPQSRERGTAPSHFG